MFTSTIILKGTVVVEDITFSWWVRDGSKPVLTVSHHKYGTATEPLADGEPLVQARAVAKRMVPVFSVRTAASSAD
jgi:hypothetical protein